jgi:hypothetical protein
MYVSRLNFYSVPGKTRELEEQLGRLLELVAKAGGEKPRVLRTHLASLGAPDLIFEQDVPDLGVLERQIKQVTESESSSNGPNKFPGCLPSLQREKSLKWRFLTDQLIFLAENLPHE